MDWWLGGFPSALCKSQGFKSPNRQSKSPIGGDLNIHFAGLEILAVRGGQLRAPGAPLKHNGSGQESGPAESFIRHPFCHPNTKCGPQSKKGPYVWQPPKKLKKRSTATLFEPPFDLLDFHLKGGRKSIHPKTTPQGNPNWNPRASLGQFGLQPRTFPEVCVWDAKKYKIV